MEKITVKKYAEYREVTEAAVKYAMIRGQKLHAVESYEKFGKVWMLLTDIKKAKKNTGFVVENLEVTKT